MKIFRTVALAALWAALAAAQPDYAPVADELDRLIVHEIADKQLPALSVGLVDNQSLVWTRHYGSAGPDTIYRVGSVSKLFTDIGIMQLVERGEIDLDAPVRRYLPEFDETVTLRQLLSHRSGLVREPPVGHYFDAGNPSLAETVRSLNSTALVYEPGSHTKYSNAGIAVAGYVLERFKNEPFAAYLKRAVLEPMGLRDSAFAADAEIARRLAKAFLWTYDGRVFEAPTFPLGMSPAGSMYSNVQDLGRFLSVLFAGGGGVIRPQTLEQMWTPQFDSGFGIGFRASELEKQRLVGHGGAIYGFATQLSALPDRKLGAVVMTTMDSANAVTSRITREALKLMLAAQRGDPLPAIKIPRTIPARLARRLAGRYGTGEKTVDLIERNGALFALKVAGGQRLRLRALDDRLITDDRLDYGTPITMLRRVERPKPRPAPEKWTSFIGEYGWDHNVLYILEKDGRLTALIEWFDYYPLEQIAEGVFRFPNWGLYDGETLAFRGAAVVGGVEFPRRPVRSDRIQPLRPVEELRREALQAEPPAEPGEFRRSDLVELTTLDPGIRLDIRYAGTNNFLSTVLYPSARAFLQRPAAEALVRAHRRLKAQGYGLLIHDAYRPWYVTRMFWDATPEDKRIFVADPAKGSRHNRGCAVDLTLYELSTGKPVEMPGAYDEMSERSYSDYPGGTGLQRWHRDLLRRVMEEQGFSVYEFEWWHFDFREWQHYPISNTVWE